MLPRFEYYCPKTVEEAVELLSKYGSEAKLLAGGTDLLVAMKDKLLKPKTVIDIKGIPELGRLDYREGEGLTIGASVTFRRILETPVIRERFHVLWDAVRQIGDEILRNRATLVGNICNASPAADSAPALLVLDASVNVVGKSGERRIPIDEFFTGVKKTALRPDEIVVSVSVPEPPKDSKGRYLKAMRVWSEDLAVVGVAAMVAGEADVRLAYASVAPTPLRIREVEEVFRRPGPLKEKIMKAAEVAAEKVSPISDVRGGAEYRLNLVKVLTRRALEELMEVVIDA